MPATVNNGDVLLCLFVNDDSSTVTTPNGWELVGGGTANGQRLSVFKKDADGSEDGTTVDFVTSAAQQAVAQVYRLSGANDIELSSPATGSGNNPNPPSFNPSGWGIEDTKWLALWLGDVRSASSAFPSGYSDGTSTISTGDTSADRAQIESCHRDNAVESEDPDTFTTSGFPQWTAWTIAISPLTIVTQSVSGASTNSGTLSTVLAFFQALSGTSSNSGALATFVNKIQALAGAAANAGALAKKALKTLTGTSTDAGALSTATVFSARWSLEHLEAQLDYGFPTVFVEVNDSAIPSGAFPEGVFFERRILEVPRVEEIELDSRFGISGFQRVALALDNSDGFFNAKDMQDMYLRMFFVNAEGTAYKEFKGQVTEWTLSHRVTLAVEDIDAIAIAGDFPIRTINELIEAEKIADAGFENVVIANDLGKPVPIIFGRAIKVPLLYVKADETDREYDYIAGEGLGLNGNPFQDVFTVYRNDQALDEINGDVAAATSTTLTLESADQRPASWYKYWWVEITAGTGTGQIRHITAYDSTNNRITVNSAWSPTPNSGSDYKLTEWRFFDGSQASPYAGYAFIRFKKRMGVSGSTDSIYADVNGLDDETNPARAIQSLLSNSDWGLGLDVDTTSFDAAAALLTDLLCEGAIIDTTGAVDVFRELLGFRDMVLKKDDEIQITVDQAKTSSFNLGLGDETGWNNILTVSPEIIHIHPNEKVKNLKVRYRKNNKENDAYLHELERSSSANGVDTTVNLPFIYDHETADRWLDYKRKRYAAAVKRLALSIGQDGDEIERGDLSTVTIPTLGISAQDWEVAGASVVPAGENTVSLIPYSALPYTYVPITSEGGELPVDESFDIPPDYTQSLPDPVTGVAVTMSMGVVGFTASPFALLTWTPPEDNYGGAVVSVKLHADAITLFRAVGTYPASARIEGLIPGQLYDFLVESLNVTGEFKGLGVLVNNSGAGYVAGGDNTPPANPSPSGSWIHNLNGSAKHGRLVWTWNKHPESDVSHYIIEIYSSTSGGSLLKRDIVPHENNASFSPAYEYQRQTGNLTSSLIGALRVAAVDHSGNTSSFTTRVGASTGDVERDDLHANATMNIETAQIPGESPGVSQSIGVWYTVISDSITIDRTGQVKVRYNGQWVPSGSGFNLRLRRGSTILKTFSGINAVNKQPATLLDERSTAAGPYTYIVETKSDVSGGIALGLTGNTLSIQGDFK